MGAQSFFLTGTGKNAEEVFNALVKEAVYERGNDSYNGTISTCDLYKRPMKVFDSYNKKNEDEAYDFAVAHDFGQKWTAYYIDLGVIGYELIEVKRENKKSDAKFEMMYNVYNYSGKKVASEKIKATAEQRAMEYSVKHNENTFIQKEPTRASGSCLVCDVSVSRKFYEKKPRAPRAPGKELVAIHKYAFYGLAAC